MKVVHIPNLKSGVVSPLMKDYISQEEYLGPCVWDWMTIEGIEKRMASRRFSQESRNVLVKALKEQYQTVANPSELTLGRIEALSEPNTFTVVTGHQLSLFTGPLYFLYKIATILNLAEQLEQRNPGKRIVPIFWMATEDHDFEEIASVKIRGQKFTWEREVEGATGRMTTEGLNEVLEKIKKVLPEGSRSKDLEIWFEEYAKAPNLTIATRQLVNHLFGERGLVIIDGDDASLKRLFLPQILDELTESKTHDFVEKQSVILTEKHKAQAYAREVNFFYLGDKTRDRIEKTSEGYSLVDQDISFSKEDLLNIANEHPERFSPNVLLRPVYQEVILPNLAYVGGGGELAYWLQLKSNFDRLDVDFPILWLRNSAGVLSAAGSHHLRRMKISAEEGLSNYDQAIRKWIDDHSDTSLQLSHLEEELQGVFKKLKSSLSDTHDSMQDAIEAEQTRQLKSIKRLEKKLLRAEKRKHTEALLHLDKFREELIPGGAPQERVDNLSLAYTTFGPAFFEYLAKHLNPTSQEYTLFLDVDSDFTLSE